MKRNGLVVVAVLALAACDAQGHDNSASSTSNSTTAATSTGSKRSTTSALPPQPSELPAVSGILVKKPTEVTLPTADPQACVREGADNSFLELHAWRVGSSGIACAEVPPAWQGRIINVDVYFPRRVTAEEADAVVRPLLPSDVQAVGTFRGTNNDVSKNPSGTCVAAAFTSVSLGAATRALNPDWTNPDSAEVVLYSGNATAGDGSSSQYDATHVHLASFGIGDPRNNGGSVTC